MSVMQSAPGPRTIIDNKEYDYFAGCGYLGFQGCKELIDAACDAVRLYGLGSSTSRKGCGDNPALLEVETRAAQFFEKEAALYYASGYMGNLILLQGLSEEYDCIFTDSSSHYSVLDAASAADKPVFQFAHLEADDLKKQLTEHVKPNQRPLVISDGVFPISGTVSPIRDYLDVLTSYDNFIVCTDDAHAVGVIGEKGQGCYEYHNLSHPSLFSSATLSKAFGGYGGIIACTAEWREKLINNARVCFASSSPPTPAAGASAKALEILYAHPEIRTKLWDNAAHAKQGLADLGFEIDETPVPIISLSSDTADIKTLPEKLKSRGIIVSRFYTGGDDYSSVPEGGCVRVAVFADHSREQIDTLIQAIGEVI